MTTIFGFIIVLGILIFVHELGHFWAARWAGAKVTVFSIGFGRPLWKWKDRKGTTWQIAAFPLGGFVSVYGLEDMFNRSKYMALSKKDKIGHYLSLRSWKRAVVIAAGSVMNLLLAWVIYTGLYTGTHQIQLPTVGQIQETTINFQPGDRITHINETNVNTWSEMLITKELTTREMTLTVMRGEEALQFEMPTGIWGILPDINATEEVHNNIFQAAKKSTNEIWMQSRLMLTVIGQMISGNRSAKQLGGVISIAETSGRAITAGIITLLAFIAMLSVNLAIINLLPFPALDGGYITIILIETIIRRKINGKTAEWILRIGWILLLTLIAFTIWNDIARVIAR